MKIIVYATILITLTFTGSSFAQTTEWPKGWVDLRADSILYGFTHPDTICISAFFTIWNGLLVDSFFVSDVGIFMDGVPVAESPFELNVSEVDLCGHKATYEDCFGECWADIYTDFGGGWQEWGFCEWRFDSLLLPNCYCETDVKIPGFKYFYLGQSTISFELDMVGTIGEPYEDNNSVSVDIVPIAVDASTWGKIKKDSDR